MSFKKLALLLIGLCYSFASFGQQIIPATFSNQATIWQGMSHRWDEGNHRYSRCGSLVEPHTNQKDSIRHAGASGSLKDRLYFNTRYTTIKTPNIAFFAGVKEIEFKKSHVQKTTVVLFVDSVQLALPNTINGVPLDQIDPQQISIALNGFDMISMKRGLPINKQYQIEKSFFQNQDMIALSTSFEEYRDSIRSLTKQMSTTVIKDNIEFRHQTIANKQKVDARLGETSKLFKLNLYIDSLKLNTQNKTLSFKVFIDFGMNCRSVECKMNTSKRIIRYLLRIGYLVIVHDKQTVNTLTNNMEYNYSWNSRKEIFYKDSTINKTITLDNSNDFQSIIPVFTGISVCTNHLKKNKPKAFHLQELSFMLNSIQPYYSIPFFHKTYFLSINLFYKTWRQGNNLFSFRSRGRVALGSEILLLAIKKEAIIDYSIRNFEGVIDFKTSHFKQTTPSDASASKVISAY